MADDPQPPKLIRPLHRQRGRRYRSVRVFDQDELAERLGIAPADVPQRLSELGWPFHLDGGGRVWATEPPD